MPVVYKDACFGTTKKKGYANSVSIVRSEIMDFLSDDPNLCKAIEEKRIGPFEFGIICETYSPERGVEE